MLSEDIFEDELDFELWTIMKYYKGFRKGELYALHGAIVDIVQDRFPSLVTFVSNHIKNIDETTLLRRLNVKLSGAQTVQEAEQTFRSLVKELS
ncbi:MAG TPA: hypothetical protein VJO32_10205 [Ktedonobacteraceae bacterium]|nr:hypothetical protein [Ktedonobacteraceae bacterium]